MSKIFKHDEDNYTDLSKVTRFYTSKIKVSCIDEFQLLFKCENESFVVKTKEEFDLMKKAWLKYHCASEIINE